MRRFLLPFLGCALMLAASAGRGQAQPQPAPRVFLLDGGHLSAAREDLRSGGRRYSAALGRLEEDVQKARSAGPFSVTSKKKTPPGGDLHDYMSMAPYFWPNPDTSNGLPYIRRDGERNPEINEISDHHAMFAMSGAVETLALGYYFIGDEACAAKAKEFLAAWFFDPATRMNPNLEYAQAVMGVNTGRGIGIIESRALVPVVDAVGLLAGSKAWTADDQRRLREWYSQFLQWMQESKNGQAETAARNNHGTYDDIQTVMYALFVGQTGLASNVLQTVARKRIDAQIEPDGREPLELARTKAWSYSIGNLTGLMQLADLGARAGVDLWHYQSGDGRSIRKAVDYLLPFGLGREKFPNQQLGGFSGRAFYPLLRQAAYEYPDGPCHAALGEIPALPAADRGRLLYSWAQ